MLTEQYLANSSAPSGFRYAPGEVLNAFPGHQNNNVTENAKLLRRPFLDRNDEPCVLLNTGGTELVKGQRIPKPTKYRILDLLNNRRIARHIPLWTLNATTMRKEDWIELDKRVQLAYRGRLNAWADLLAASPFPTFNAYGKLTLEYEAMSDPMIATADMDGLSDAGTNDTPLFKLRSQPLPIIHTDFFEADRILEVSKNSTGLDVLKAEAGSRRIAEMVERTVIGVTGGISGFAYGGQSTGITAHDTATYTSALGASTIYGYTTFPMRLTKTNFTAPTTTNGPTTYQEVLTALNQLRNINAFGPFMLYHSTDWDPYMDNPFSTAGGNHPGETLRTMLMKIPDIQGVKRLDFLTSTYTLIFVKLSSEVASGLNGMEISTVQWESHGGFKRHWKIWCIQVPVLRGDYSGNTGILHGTTA